MQTAGVYSIPAPVGGINARDPLAAMSETDALTLENIFPDERDCSLRNGFRVHSSSLGTGVVETLAALHKQDGTKKLVGCANNKIYDATTLSGTASDITGAATITSNRWQTIHFKETLLFFNGVDQPLQWSGTGNVSAAAYTGITDDAVLIGGASFKQRLYLVEKDSFSFWYAGVGSITGAATEFDLNEFSQLGGYLMFVTSWSRDIGDGMDDLFVAVSSEGEVFAYQGDSPAGTWAIVGRYEMPKPLGRRSHFKVGGDVYVITERGVIPLSSVLFTGQDASYSRISDKIDSLFAAASRNYGTNFGWQGVVYPKAKYGLINVPTASAATSEQFVWNTITGSWCTFSGMNAQAWALHNGNIYFGGTDGKVYQADFGKNDGGNNITVDIETAFTYCGDPVSIKKFVLSRPQLVSDGDVSFDYDINVDYERKQVTSTVTNNLTAGTLWDTSLWDSFAWGGSNVHVDDWVTVSGVGKSASIRLQAAFKNVTFGLAAIDLMFKRGGIR